MPPPKACATSTVRFAVTMQRLIVKVPELFTPPPLVANPLRTVTLESVTVLLEIVTTVATPPPSIIVVLAPEPIIVKLLLMVRFSV